MYEQKKVVHTLTEESEKEKPPRGKPAAIIRP
jgi:hypothetical protein